MDLLRLQLSGDIISSHERGARCHVPFYTVKSSAASPKPLPHNQRRVFWLLVGRVGASGAEKEKLGVCACAEALGVWWRWEFIWKVLPVGASIAQYSNPSSIIIFTIKFKLSTWLKCYWHHKKRSVPCFKISYVLWREIRFNGIWPMIPVTDEKGWPCYVAVPLPYTEFFKLEGFYCSRWRDQRNPVKHKAWISTSFLTLILIITYLHKGVGVPKHFLWLFFLLPLPVLTLPQTSPPQIKMSGDVVTVATVYGAILLGTCIGCGWIVFSLLFERVSPCIKPHWNCVRSNGPVFQILSLR